MPILFFIGLGTVDVADVVAVYSVVNVADVCNSRISIVFCDTV